jgi:hypothetical protein
MGIVAVAVRGFWLKSWITTTISVIASLLEEIPWHQIHPRKTPKPK